MCHWIPPTPLARLRYMVQDAQTGLLLTSDKDLTLASQLVQPGCQLLNLEALSSSIGNANPGLAIAPEALAYIIYTSGSTAQPKGVMQSHRNVLHKIMISTNDYHLGSADRRTLLYSPSSSGSVWEIFSSMLNGGSLHVFDMRTDGIANMASWLMHEDITIYSSVPTLFRQVVSTLTGAESFPRLRMVNLGGEAVVIQRADETGEPHLVAYVVPVRQPAPTVSALRRTLADVVPAHMLPAAFVMLEALPLTPAGKVDRRVLPAPDRARPDLGNPFVAPRLPVETQVAAIWAEVMDLEQVGLHDNFLELGGHSLQATQIIARVIRTLRVELPVQALFNAPTVAEMAMLIIQHQAQQATPEDMERMLAELEALSDESAKKLRADNGAGA